jgi:hypothetical protein
MQKSAPGMACTSIITGTASTPETAAAVVFTNMAPTDISGELHSPGALPQDASIYEKSTKKPIFTYLNPYP